MEKDQPAEASQSEASAEGPLDLPAGLTLLLSPEHRELAIVLNKICTDASFREAFWRDPGLALNAADLQVHPQVVEHLRSADRAVIEKIVEESRTIFERSQGFTYDGEAVAVIPLVAAAFVAGALAGALVSEVLHHHFTHVADN
ncbi:hypothetical protein [Streptomyces sp. NEAU-174]|uniref:hypothetical protein n=1 Tax=Streptomyces sp. NEAU-174 TaxID=3458254 RepID=UPI0040441795